MLREFTEGLKYLEDLLLSLLLARDVVVGLPHLFQPAQISLFVLHQSLQGSRGATGFGSKQTLSFLNAPGYHSDLRMEIAILWVSLEKFVHAVQRFPAWGGLQLALMVFPKRRTIRGLDSALPPANRCLQPPSAVFPSATPPSRSQPQAWHGDPLR